MMDPPDLHALVSALYGEIADKLPVDSWNCREIACLALAADRARGGRGHLAVGMMRLPNGNSSWHAVYITDSPRGLVIDGCEGKVRLSERHTLGLTLPATGMQAVPVPRRKRRFPA